MVRQSCWRYAVILEASPENFWEDCSPFELGRDLDRWNIMIQSLLRFGDATARTLLFCHGLLASLELAHSHFKQGFSLVAG